MDFTQECVVAVDLGYKRSGVAITSNHGLWILPLGTIELVRFNGNQWFDHLRQMLKPYWKQIQMVVVGDPVSGLDNVTNKIQKYVDQVLRILKTRTPFTVLTFNERYSSQWAEDTLKRINFSHQYINKHINGMAAAKILKDFLFDRFLLDYEITMIK